MHGLARLALKLDPALILPEIGLAGSDAWQVALLRSRAGRILVNCHRQAGKSTASAGMALHAALCGPGALVLIVSPSLRQSGETMRKVFDGFEALGRPVEAVEDNTQALALANGSRIVSLPGSEATVRGFSAPALVIVDEASRIEDELFPALSPMLAISRGKLVELSTPYGKRGHFWQAWNGGPEWERIEFRASENPRLDPAWLAEERLVLGPRRYAQEYECEFTETDDAVFTSESIEAAFDSERPALFGA